LAGSAKNADFRFKTGFKTGFGQAEYRERALIRYDARRCYALEPATQRGGLGSKMSRDQAFTGVLDGLDRDIADRPVVLRPVPEELVERARHLVRGVELDLETPLGGDQQVRWSSLSGGGQKQG
jgi:hypothetical protein